MICFSSDLDEVELRLQIVGYEFPHIQSGADANWLFVRLHLKSKGESFRKDHPSLEVHDLLRLSDWFESLCKGDIPKTVDLGFVEPNLEFRLLGADETQIRFSISLDAEFWPDFNSPRLAGFPADPNDDFVALLSCTRQQAGVYATQFSTFAEQFPIR
jgi:hypothetical protein